MTVTANGNAVDSPNKSVTVSGTAAGGNGVANPPNVTLTLTDDDALPTVALALSSTSITETGGVSTVTATLSGPSSAAVTVTVAAAAGAGAVAADFTLSTAATLTFAAGATTSTGVVTVTANGNDVDSPNKTVTVSGTAAGGNGVSNPPDATLTLTDDDALPTVALALSSTSITETGGVSTVTARLSGKSSAAVTVTVAAAAGTGAVAADFAQSGTTLTIAAGATTSAGTVTVTANGNAVDSPNKSVTVSGTAAGGNGVSNPPNVTLTLTDDDALPTVSLALAPSSIAETNGVATVTARLSGASSAAVTVTVAAAAGTGAVAADFTLSGATILTIAAGSTESAGLVTVTANGNDVDAPNKSVTVSGTAAGGNGVANPPNATLTLADDDTAGIAVSPATSTTSRLRTTESGGTATFTVALDSEPTGDVELDVASSDTDEGTAAPAVLTFTSSTWSTAQTVTLTGVDDSPPAADGSQGYTVTLTVDTANTADSNYDALSAVTVYAVNSDNEFGLDVGSVTGQATEGGGQATFTVALRTQPTAAVTVSVSSRDVGEGSVSPPSLTFTTGGWNTAQTVTVTGVQDTIDDGTVTWAVRLDPASGDGNYDTSSVEEDVSVTTTDDDGPPGVTLALNPSSVAESGTGNAATVTARLSHPSGAATTVTVTAVSGFFTAGSGAAGTIVIPAGQTAAATDTALVTAVDNTTDAPDRTETVTATVTNARAATDGMTMAVTGAALTVTDDDAAPGVTLALSPASISENGGESTVSATLSRPSSQPSTVTVTAVSGLYTVGTDATIVIAAGATTAASDTVLVTAVDDSIHQGSAGRGVTVTAALANGQGAGAVTGAALTLTDDETLPVVSLVLGPASISEEGGVSAVTAALSGPSSAAVTLTVSAAAGTRAVAADFTQSGTALTIAAGATTSAGTVTVTANGNAVASGNKQVTVSATSAGGNGVANPSDASLTLADDDTPQTALVLSSSSIAENGGVATVTATLDRQSSVAVTVTVAAAPVSPAVAGDFTLSTAATLTFAANATTSAGLVTVTAVNNAVDAPDRRVTVSGTASDSLNLANDPSSRTLTLTDDDAAPGVTLALSPASISENGGESTVSATLSRPSSQPSTVTVTAVAGAYAVGTDATIVIAAGATTSASDTATVTAVDDDVHQGSAGRSATVTASLANGQGAGAVTGAALTLTDDEAAPGAAMALNPASVSENGGVATVTATLSHPSAAPTTLTVSASPASPAVAGDFTLSSANTLTVAAGSTTSSGAVTVTANDNRVDAADKSVTVTATLANGRGTGAVTAATLTLTDDDTAAIAVSPATSTGSRLVTTESAGTATFTVKLATEPTGDVEIGVASSDTGEGTVGPSTLTFTASDWSTAQTVTLTGVDDSAADGNRDYTVTLTIDQTNTADSNYDALSAVTVYARNRDNEFGLNVSAVTGQATEGGGQATFTVALRTQPTAAVTVSVASRDAGEGSVSPPSLTFTGGATGNWNTAQTVTVTGANDSIDDGTVTWAVRLDPASGDGDYDASSVEEDVSVTTTDDDGPPGVTLALNPSSIAESGTGNAATVTARLSHPSGAATTVTVTAVSGLYAAGTDAAIVIPAGSTQAASDTATVVAVDNATDAPDRAGTVTAAIANARAAADGTTMSVMGAALTVRDDDPAPTAVLALDPASVTENGGLSTVTATLSRPSSQPSTVTVTAVSGAYTVGTDATITIAAGATTAATDTVLVTAVDDSVHQGTAGRSATVTATLANGQGAGAVTGAALTLTDDETLPVAALVLGPASISENGGLSTVTATLTGPSSAAVTVTVSTASSSDYTQTGSTLMIAAGATTSAGLVTVRGTDNAVASGSRQVTVSATAAGGNGVANPPDAALTITDDDTPQTTLVLSSSSIAENGGVATVTATLDRQSAVAVTVTVAATAVSPAVAGDFTQTGTVLTFAANATTSTGLVTVTAVNNTTDAPNKSVTVSGTASDSLGQTNHPPSVTLAITDDDAAPTATLALNPSSVTENAGMSTVSATLSHPSSQPSTVTVAGAPGSYTVGTDATIVIAAGSTTAASDTVLVTAVDDPIHQGTAGRSATVTASLANGQGAGAVTGAALTLTDDEAAPGAAMALNPASVTENGGVATVTATLSHPSAAPTTLTVSASPVSPAAAGDFTLSSANTLTVAAGSTTSAGTVTVTANDNRVDAADKSVTVSATPANGRGTGAVTAATLTLTDDDTAAIVASRTSGLATTEAGGQDAFTVTLATRPTGDVRIDVASSDTAQGTVMPATLTFTAGDWSTAQTVTLTGVNDSPPAADGSQTYDVTLTIDQTNTADAKYDALSGVTVNAVNRDDEFGLDLGVSVAAGLTVTEAGGTATFTLALLTQPSAAVTVAVSSRDPGEGTASPSSLVFTTGNWNTARTVTVTGVDDSIDDGTVTWQVRLDPASGDANYDGLDDVDVDVTTTDNDRPPTVTLALDPASIPENGGVSTVTARLSHPSSADTTVTVTASPVESSGAVAGDYTLSSANTLTIAAGSISSGGVVTITARNNDVDAASDKTVTVSGSAENDQGIGAVTGADLTLTDDDEKGLTFDPATATLVAEGGSVSYRAALTSMPTGTVTVSVSPPDDADLTVSPDRLTFAPSDWKTAQTVTVTGIAGAAASKLTHEGTGGGYGGVERDLWVAGSAADEIETTGRETEITTTTTIVNGQPVRQTVAPGVPPGVKIVLPPPADRLEVTVLEVSVRLSTDAEADEVAEEGYSVGPAASRVAVDVAVSPVPPGGVRLCLPVTDALWAAAAGRPLILFHNGARVESSPMPPDGRVMEICADGVASFSPFALGYKDTVPTFGDLTIGAMVFTVGEDIGRKELPKATGGDRTDNELLPKPWVLPRGLTFDEETGVLSGTPEETFEERNYVWTATDVDGDRAEPPLRFSIEVVPPLKEARARLKAINESILPELSRATWGSAVDAVTRRLESPDPGGGVLASGLASAASMLRSNERALEEGAASWKDLLAGESFAVGLGPGAGSAAVAWGSGERRRLSLDKEALDWSGDLFSAHMGVDAPLGGGLRGGLAASWFEGEIEYADRSGEAAIAGVHESRLAAAHPYLGWSGPDGSRLWGVMGYGRGKIEIADAEVAERFGVQKGDSAFAAAAAGGSVPVLSAGELTLALKASGEATRYSVEDNGSAIAAAAAKTQRLRLAAEGTRTYALPDGGTLSPSLEAGARWDGGDGETGLGVEVGGGLSWASDNLSVEARGRALAAHEGDVEEWGAAGSARLSPGFGGRGLSLSLSPGWGASESGLARLWDDGAAASGGAGGARLEAELGYGFRAWAGLATPRAGFNYEESGQRRWRLGTRFEFGPGLALDVEAERKEGAADTDHGVRLELRLKW